MKIYKNGVLVSDTSQEDDIPDEIFAMANVRGKNVVHPGSLPFSFYFSPGNGVSHGIRVKPVFNPERMTMDAAGTLKLCDDWSYTPGKNDRHVSASKIRDMKQFFRDNIILFCVVWNGQISDGVVEEYFIGRTSLHELITELDFYEDYQEDLDNIRTVRELENYCRRFNLVNLHGN